VQDGEDIFDDVPDSPVPVLPGWNPYVLPPDNPPSLPVPTLPVPLDPDET